MCVLYASPEFSGFRMGRVNFGAKTLVDVASLPQLGGVENGVAAGAEDGVFYVPSGTAYDDLLEVNIIKNTSIGRNFSSPPGFSGELAFYVMDLNVATGDLYAFLEEASLAWVVGADVNPVSGTTAAFTPDLRSEWLSFEWIKAGVSAVDSKRGTIYIVVGQKASPGVCYLAGLSVLGGGSTFSYLEGPPLTDLVDLSYSTGYDVFVALCFNMTTGIATTWSRPADVSAAHVWTKLYQWPLGQVENMQLGMADTTDDGKTLFLSFFDGKTGYPYVAQMDVNSGKIQNSFTFNETFRRDMMLGDVAIC